MLSATSQKQGCAHLHKHCCTALIAALQALSHLQAGRRGEALGQAEVAACRQLAAYSRDLRRLLTARKPRQKGSYIQPHTSSPALRPHLTNEPRSLR